MKIIAAALAWAALLLAPPAMAQPRTALSEVRAALASAELLACADDTSWIGRRVRVGVVVYPDGAWAIATGPIEPAGAGGEAFADCARAALTEKLPQRLDRPPRHARAVTHAVEVPDPRPDLLRARLDRARRPIEGCLLRELVDTLRAERPARRVRVQVHVHVRADGAAWAEVTGVEPGPRGASRAGRLERELAARCVIPRLGDYPAAGAPLQLEQAFEMTRSPALARPDGSEGAICAWGADRREGPRTYLPEPRPCRAGLRCCAPGYPGADSACRRTRRCPALP